MSKDKIYRIRPAGRHILTIGRDLIKDSYAAVVELVKNAYDADSPDVIIEFRAFPEGSGYSIAITDHGHGMPRDTVINKWLVPSTDDKLLRRVSPSGRIMQGSKGIGRYAASILGKDILLETVTKDGEKTTVYIEWKNFEEAQYLDDVEVLVETTSGAQPSGTKLTITGNAGQLAEWEETQFKKLRFELKKLISPVSATLWGDAPNDDFSIKFTVDHFSEAMTINETIEPFPIFDLFDYKIAGKVMANGKAVLKYSQQKARNTTEEEIEFELGTRTGCGDLVFDIRVYDREKEAIESLINRGLKDDSDNYVSRGEARKLLNDYNGIGVYRNGFRIRPLGDAEFDWLKLNEQRVQNPSLRIGSNQAIGYVQIQSEEQAGLIEKSARDGLKENAAYERLKHITTLIIHELEERRFIYRRKAGLSKPALKLEQELERLFSYDEMKSTIRAKLTKGGLDQKTAEDIIGIISQQEEEQNRIAEDIRQAVAIYQGQATLGKIINVILHEGRHPLNYFTNQIPNLQYWYNAYLKSEDDESLDRIIPIAEGIGKNAEVFVKLFSRLDPFAAGKRSSRKPLVLKKTILETFNVFEAEMKKHNVSMTITGPDEFKLLLWYQDVYAIFTNLIDNSIYWMSEKRSIERYISIELATNGDSLLYIDYRDTGPGIESAHIVSGVIFEPQFSTKPEGTGLGLAIAGEAAFRNGLELKAFESEKGAYFRIQPKGEAN